MGSGSRTPKMRRIDSRNKKMARIKRQITAAKTAAAAKKRTAR